MVAKDHTCIHEHACLYAQQIIIKGDMLSWPSVIGSLYAKTQESENDMDTHTDTCDSYFVCIAHENGSDITHET